MMGEKEAQTNSGEYSNIVPSRTSERVRQCRQGAKAMNADNVTYQGLARRAGELVRPDVWRSGDGEADVPRARAV